MIARLAASLLLLGVALPALGATPEASDRHPLWVIEGESNSVFLLGSVHVLRASDYPLPEALERAYREAETLYMEIDLDDLDPAAATAFTLGNGSLPEETSLAGVLGPARFAAAQERAAALGLDLRLFARFEPWVAAITVLQLQLIKLGFDVNQGVEQHFLREAVRDEKEIRGLETLEDQLGVLDALSLDRQGEFLMMSLEDAATMREDVETLIRAWRAGDAEELATTLTEEFEDFPDLYRQLIVARNRNWAEQIRALLDDDEDYLVVVGALHLVGDDSVLELLRARGIRARQL